jgi:hypothetical protein
MDLLTDFAALCLADFIDWRYTFNHGWYFRLSVWTVTPWTKETKCTVCTDSVWLGGGGGVELCCRPYSAGVLYSASDQIQNPQNCFTTQTNITSTDDIKGLVSLKFLRPWIQQRGDDSMSEHDMFRSVGLIVWFSRGPLCLKSLET